MYRVRIDRRRLFLVQLKLRVKNKENLMKKLILSLLVVLMMAQSIWGATVSLGILTDTHYYSDPLHETYGGCAYPCDMTYRLTNIQEALDTFETAAVTAVFFLGDTYQDNNTTLSNPDNPNILVNNIGGLEGLLDTYSFTNKIHFVLGNHDKDGATRTEISAASDYYPANGVSGRDDCSTWCADRFDYFYDITGSNIRAIIFDTVNTPGYETASADTLTWLETTLSDARTAGKKALLFSHTRLNGADGADCVCNNASAVRTKIEAAVTAGLTVLGYFNGHCHANLFSPPGTYDTWTAPTTTAIEYYSFNKGYGGTPSDVPSYSLVTINDSTNAVTVTGYGEQYSYHASPYYVDCTSGNNNNPGTSSAPKAGLEYTDLMVSQVPEATTINVSGLCRELLSVASGTSGKARTWQFNNATISGSDIATGWALVSGNVYSKTFTTQVKVVIWNGTLLVEDPGATTNVATNKWDWDANVLYVNLGGVSPDTGTLEAGQRAYGLQFRNANYVTTSGPLTVYGCNKSGVVMSGNANSVTLTNIESKQNGTTGFHFIPNTTGISSLTFSHLSAHHNVRAAGFHLGLGTADVPLKFTYITSYANAYGIYTDNNSASFSSCYNCTIANNTIMGFHYGGNDSGYLDVKNMITSNGANYGIRIRQATAVGTIDEYVYNDVYSGQAGVTVTNAQSATDPQFVDLASSNFRLKPVSPCIDSGVDWGITDGTTTDIYGVIHNKVHANATNVKPWTGPSVDIGASETPFYSPTQKVKATMFDFKTKKLISGKAKIK